MSDSYVSDGQSHGGLQRNQDGLQSRVNLDKGYTRVNPSQIVHWHARHICRVDIDSVDGLHANGTGFLVGPDLVLTNYHVVENCDPEKIKCRFDCRDVGPDNFEVGPPVDVEKVVRSSPFSRSEYERQYSGHSTVHPNDNELDYALLKLVRRIGEENYTTKDGVGARGWIALPATKPNIHPNSRVHILQHPKGRPLKSADGSLSEQQPTTSRLRYLANTESGSSGSPCFQFTNSKKPDLTVVALHNYGDPGWGDGTLPEFNHGIPIELITKDLHPIELPPPPDPGHRGTGPIIMAAVAIVSLAIAAVLQPILTTPPAPTISGASTAWLLPLKDSNPNSRTALVLNVKVVPNSEQPMFYAASLANLHIGGKRHAMQSRYIVDMTERCMYSRLLSCRVKGSRLWKISEPSEFDVMLSPAPTDSFPGWRSILRSLDRNEFQGFSYSVFYRLLDDQKVYKASFECAFSKKDLATIAADKRFDLDNNLRPAIAPSVDCKEISVEG